MAVSPTVKWTMIAVLASIAAGYFGVMAWKANSLARVLLRRGYAEKGYDEPRLAARLRLLGVAGLALSLAGMAAAITRAGG